MSLNDYSSITIPGLNSHNVTGDHLSA